jgi:hypothetical protein
MILMLKSSSSTSAEFDPACANRRRACRAREQMSARRERRRGRAGALLPQMQEDDRSWSFNSKVLQGVPISIECTIEPDRAERRCSRHFTSALESRSLGSKRYENLSDPRSRSSLNLEFSAKQLRKPFGQYQKIQNQFGEKAKPSKRPKTKDTTDDGGWRRHGLLYVVLVSALS